MQTGEIHRTITDDTMLGGSIERIIVYKAPFVKCDREEEYEVAWGEFERGGIPNRYFLPEGINPNKIDGIHRLYNPG